MTTVYIADDGREFDHKDDCLEYERQQSYQAGVNIIFGFDSDGKALLFTDESFCEEVFILFLCTQEAVEIYQERCGMDYASSEGIYDPGIYIWDNDDYAEAESCGWTYLPDLLSIYEEKVAKLKSLEERFNSMK